MNFIFNKQSGQASRLLLILAIVVFVAGILVFFIMKATAKPPEPVGPVEEIPPKVYEAKINDIKFTFQEAVDMGNVLWGSRSRTQYQKDIKSTEKFIAVTVGAQNKGKANIKEDAWDLGNIVDSEGRVFEPMEKYTVSNWLPDPDLCGALLKPEFTPVPCKKIYEVSKASTGLKINLLAGRMEADGEYSTDPQRMDSALIDLIITPQ